MARNRHSPAVLSFAVVTIVIWKLKMVCTFSGMISGNTRWFEVPEATVAAIADTRQRYVDEPIDEIPHPLTPKRRPHTDFEVFADLETGDCFPSLGRDDFLAGDHLERSPNLFDPIILLKELADAHVHDHPVDLRERIRILRAEKFLQGRQGLRFVIVLGER